MKVRSYFMVLLCVSSKMVKAALSWKINILLFEHSSNDFWWFLHPCCFTKTVWFLSPFPSSPFLLCHILPYLPPACAQPNLLLLTPHRHPVPGLISSYLTPSVLQFFLSDEECTTITVCSRAGSVKIPGWQHSCQHWIQSPVLSYIMISFQHLLHIPTFLPLLHVLQTSK